jgi:DNA helicase HerA-like ATPase
MDGPQTAAPSAIKPADQATPSAIKPAPQAAVSAIKPAAQAAPSVVPAAGAVADQDADQALGRVTTVTGAKIVAHVAKPTGLQASHPVQIGTVIKMESPQSIVYGVITELTIPEPGEDGLSDEMQMADATLIGEVPRSADGKMYAFRRGISNSPSLDAVILRATNNDLARIYAAPSAPSVKIGVIHQDTRLPAHVLTDELLGKHFAILGTTGCGKSCTVVLVMRAILEKHPNAHIVMLDPHNEYSKAFGDRAEILNTETMELPYWLLNFDELLEAIFGGRADTGSPEASILHHLVPLAKQDYLQDPTKGKHFTVDTPAPYKFSDLVRRIDMEMGKLEKAEEGNAFRRLRNRLLTLQNDNRFAFMFSGLAIDDNMSKIIGRIFRIPVDGKPISIIDLSGVPSEILNVVVSVITRLSFELALWCERTVPILLVCEEAHLYAPQKEDPRFDLSKRALSRIAKEGRKYGASLCVVSQRPSQLSDDLISQCNTLIAMRMTNNDDQEHLRGSMSQSSAGLMDFLPMLGNGEAVVVGQGVSLPVRIKFVNLPPEHQPHSATAVFSKSWEEGMGDTEFVQDIVNRWRRVQ